MKKYIFLFLATCMIHQSFGQMIYDVEEYVLGTLIQVFDPMPGGEGYNDLEALQKYDRKNNDCVVEDIKEIERNILNNNNIRLGIAWNLLRHWSNSIDEKTIQYAMNEEIEKFVNNKSYNTALYKTKNNAISQKVAKSILGELQKKHQSASFLFHGIFRNFIGNALKQKARECCNRFEQPLQTQHHHDLYPSENCCVCFDSFKDVQRIYLMPCGHDICKVCAQQWFFDQRKNSCPQCRAITEKNDLRIALQNNRPPAYNPEWPEYR